MHFVSCFCKLWKRGWNWITLNYLQYIKYYCSCVCLSPQLCEMIHDQAIIFEPRSISYVICIMPGPITIMEMKFGNDVITSDAAAGSVLSCCYNHAIFVSNVSCQLPTSKVAPLMQPSWPMLHHCVPTPILITSLMHPYGLLLTHAMGIKIHCIPMIPLEKE